MKNDNSTPSNGFDTESIHNLVESMKNASDAGERLRKIIISSDDMDKIIKSMSIEPGPNWLFEYGGLPIEGSKLLPPNTAIKLKDVGLSHEIGSMEVYAGPPISPPKSPLFGDVDFNADLVNSGTLINRSRLQFSKKKNEWSLAFLPEYQSEFIVTEFSKRKVRRALSAYGIKNISILNLAPNGIMQYNQETIRQERGSQKLNIWRIKFHHRESGRIKKHLSKIFEIYGVKND